MHHKNWKCLMSSPFWYHFFIFLMFLLSYYCCIEDTLWYLQNFLGFIKHITLELTLSIILLYPSPFPPFLERFQQVSFFHFHTCVHKICIILTRPCHFSHILPHPPGTNGLWQDLFALLLSNFVKEKNFSFVCLR
jgi:hypothetical protein